MSICLKNQNSTPKLFLQPKYADVHFEFKSNGQTVRVPAHKNILAVNSTVFDAMFFGPMKENDVVEIVDATESEFKAFLQLFYRVDVELTIENIESVVRLADKYDMIDCLNACATLLVNNLSDDKMIWAYQLAIYLKHENLKQFCEKEIQKSASNIFKSDAFLQCDRIVLENILKVDKMDCDEVDVFNGCIEWAKSSCRRNGLDDNKAENLRNELGECFLLIQFRGMTTEQMGAILSNDVCKELFSRNELLDIMCAKSVESYNSEIFKHIPRSKRTLEWKSDKVLECLRYGGDDDWVYLKSQESTWFSTNKPVKLGGKITCGDIYARSSVDTKAIVSIIEYDSQTVSYNVERKVLFFDDIIFHGIAPVTSFVILPQPILIKPNKMYQIRFYLDNWDRCQHESKWKTEVKLDDETIIKFHTNPSDNNHDRRGLVHSLQFNRI